MTDGFLGTRGSLMQDTIVTALALAIPLLLASIYLVRARRNYRLHRAIQTSLAGFLLVALAGFELELRVAGWQDRAVPSRYWQAGAGNDWIDLVLAIHLCFAIPTPFLWGWVLYRAWREFPSPPRPARYSMVHRRWGTVASGFLILTAITGWWFYWLAFVA